MKRLLILAALLTATPVVSLCQTAAQGASSNLLKETSIESLPLTDTLKDENPKAQSNQASFADDESGRFWASAEYLLWKMKRSNLPPLITVGPESGDAIIGEAGTVVAFGGDKLDRGKFPGGRFTAGAWLGERRGIGVELSYFFLKERTFNFQISSSGRAGSRVISRPFFDVIRRSEGVVLVAFPSFSLSGSSTVTSPSHLRGAEANLLYRLSEDHCCRIKLLAGFRYLELREELNVTDITDDLLHQTNPNHTVDTDQFGTRNQFYGGQTGVRSAFNRGRFNLEMSGTLALGSNRESVEINGQTSGTIVIPFSSPGGVLALVSNIGRYRRSEFAVVPELRASLGYDITRKARAFVGYNFLYWNKVARPGEQIDRIVNPLLVPNLGGPLTSTPLRPAFTFRSTSFWAQGLTTGIKIRF